MRNLEQFTGHVVDNNGQVTVILQENTKLMLARDVAQKWGCDANFVRKLYRIGLLKGIKFSNKTVKFRREEIDRFEKWAEDKDLSDLEHITDVRTGQKIHITY